MTHRRIKLVGVVLLALVALYAAAGLLLSPWLLQRYLPGFLEQKLQRQVSVGTVRVNPFLLNLEMRDISVEGRHGQPVLSAARAFADLAFMGLFRRTWMVDELRLEGLRAHVVLERDGSLNLLDLAQRFAGGDTQPGRGPPPLIVDQLAVPAARIVFTDLTGEARASAVAEPVTLNAAGLSTLDDELASHELTAVLPEGGEFRWHGELGLYPAVVASGDARVHGLAAKTLWPFLRDELQLSEFEGTASGSTRYVYDREQSLRLEGVTLGLEDVRLARPGERGRLLEMRKIALAAGSLDLAQHAVAIGSLEFQSGQVAVVVAQDGRLDWAAVVAPGRATGRAESAGAEPVNGTGTAVGPAAKASEDDWKLEVASLRTDQVGVRYIDRSRERPLRVEVSDLAAQLALSISGGPAAQVLAQGIGARLQNLVVAPAAAADPAAAFRSVHIEQGRFDLRDKFVGAQRLGIEGGTTSIVRQQDGELPLLELLGAADDKASRNRARQVAEGTERGNWHYDLGALSIQSVEVALADRTFEPAVVYDLQVQSITATNLASSSEAPTPFQAVVQARQGGTLRASGILAGSGESVQVTIELRQLATAPLGPVIESYSGLAVRAGPLSLSGKVRYVAARKGPPQLTLNALAASLPDLVLRRPGADEPTVALQRLQVRGGSLNLANRSVQAHEIVLTGGEVRVVRAEDGDIAILESLGQADQTARADVATRAGATGDASPAWRYGIGLLRVDSVHLALVDRGFEPALSLGGTLQASVKNLGQDRRASFDASLAVNGGGTIRSEGTAALAGPVVQARLEIKDVRLKPLQPLIQRFAAVRVQSGAVSASAAVRSGGDAGALRSEGSFRIADLLVNEAPSGDRLLAWKLLEADKFVLNMASRQLVVNEVTVQDPGAKIVISRQRNLNLTRLLKPAEEDREPGESAAVRQPEGERQAAGVGAPAGFGFLVERVRLHNGNVDFADLSLVLPFSTRVTQIEGTIVGISNDPSRRADVRARGAIQRYGSARVEGSFLPAEPEQFTNLHVQFDNVLVPPLSPYTATFAGRKVQSGKLWLDLEYRIEDSVLLGDNDIRLSDFTLGEEVEAPNAMNVPLNLAVALLTDGDGQIRLSVPVRGDLDNPRFSVGSAIRQAVANAVRRIVTAPFRALGRLLGGAAESLAKVEFDAGSAALQPEQREKLDKLSQALAERPRVQLVVTAPYDPQADARALQRAQARRALARTLGRSLRPGEDPGPIAYDDPATRRALERLLQLQVGPGAVRELRAQAFRSGRPERELYEAMFERIAAGQPLGSAAVQVLATERARGIANYLQQQGVAAARVQTGRLSTVDAGRDGAVTAQLGVASAGTAR